jgi:glyoxylase-like metal-dependent hydrolase (beta-lactamase superfamily II)
MMDDFIQSLSEEFKNIYMVKGDRNGNYPYSHSLLIGDVIIDTGVSIRHLKKVKDQFPINSVILSHWHEDHIAGNHLFNNAEFFCHKKDKAPVEDIEEIFRYYNVVSTKAEGEFRAMLRMYAMKNTKISKTISDNELIKVGDHLQLKVIHTPGHTAGHCGFYEINSKIAFFGDMDLTRFPYYATIDSDLLDFENSIEKLKKFEIEIAILGHKDPVFGKKAVQDDLDKFQEVIDKRDERILAQLSEKNPVQPSDLKGKNLIYRKYAYANFEVISELVMIEKHFEKFLKHDLITEKESGYVLT